MRNPKDYEYLTTFVEGKKETAADLKKGDIVYARKHINDYPCTYELRFIKLERGIITGTVLRENWNGNAWQKPAFVEKMTARVANCFLWGQKGDDYTTCHWFKSKKDL